jgi:pyruvate formate lyase activating enzyme
MEHEARLYEAIADGSVRCHLCGHHCVISDGKLGVCQVRKNIGGTLYALSYGQIISQCVDPIEKKPLYHFYPGSKSYSIATLGCNFHCKWCQNWHISQIQKGQRVAIDRDVAPREIVADAQYTGSRSIAYTYTEPTVFFEFAYDTAQLAHTAGLANIYVTNGYMSGDMLDVFQKTLDGANVDLKSFRKTTYQRLIGARLQSVLDSLVKMKELGIWLEVTTLVVPEVNDDPDELQDIANFISLELGADTPWHISRFFPYYRMTDRPPTPMVTLHRAQEIGLEAGLRYVYVGNVSGGNETICPGCGKILIRRYGYAVSVEGLDQGRCEDCGTLIAGVW